LVKVLSENINKGFGGFVIMLSAEQYIILVFGLGLVFAVILMGAFGKWGK